MKTALKSILLCTILYSIYSFIPPGNSPQNSLPPSGEIVFFDDFETPSFGPMWSNSSSTSDGLIRIGESIEGIATPQAGTGAVIMGKTTDGAFNINSLDLALSLAAYQGQQLYLSFFIRHYWEERDDNDGLYFSDDGGQSFVKVLDFAFDEWTPNAYGQLPPIDMTALSKRYNLNFTNDFIVRFQQADNADFNNSGDEDGLLLDNVLIREESVGYASLPFQEDFESGTLSDNWTWATPLNTISSPSYIRPCGRLTIDSSDFAAAEGSRGLLMGRWVDGAYTVNAIDLHLDLAAQQTAYLQFNVMDFVDETDPEDGLYFSDDGGENFQKVLRFDNGDWTDAYGLHAPIPIHRLASRHGLQLSERFVIRFQQGGSGDFNYSGAEDGLLLDNVRVYSQSPSYASLPYNDGFEGSLSSSWQWNLSDQTSPPFSLDNGGWMQPVNWPNIAFEGTQALAMGRTFDGTYSCVAADLHLDLDNYAEVQLQFQFRPFYDESEDVDALYFSDDGGENFTKVARLNPASLPVDQYSLLQFDIDSLAALYQLNLSSRFVIRFQQGGSGDFNFSGAEDGFLIDQLQVSGQLNADGPSLDGFAPAQGRIRDRIELQGKKFSTDCQVFFNGQAAEEVQFIDEQRLEAVIPPLATSGRIKVQNALGQDISNEDFTVLNRQIIFFEDFESATLRSMWTANSSAATGFVSVDQAFGGITAPFEGLYGAVLGQTADGEVNINTLDLAIPLAAHQDSELALSFYIKHFNEEYEAEDGLYLSDDGGQNFVKVADFRFDGWTNNAYGQLPPFDLDQLAMDNGLILNDDFVIRFQHSSNADFNFSGDEDGLFLDNILLREETTPYLRLPFEDGFETNALLPAWTWSRPLNTISSPEFIRPGGTATISASDFAAANGLNGLFLGRNYDGGYTVNALDLHLDLSRETAVYLQFSIRDFVDETNPEDGLYFSDDGGVSFRKVWRFNTGDWTDGYGLIPPLPVHRLASQNGLTLSNRFVIRFQQAGSGDLNFSGDEDGILLDDVRVFSQPPVYASLPFTDGFENGLGSAWQWTLSDQTSPFSQLDNGGFVTEVDWQGFVFEGEKALAMGRAFDGTATTLAADLHLNLENYAQANLQFQFLPFYEEDDNTDGIWFSDDGGAHFTKVVQLLPASLSPTNYTPIQVDIDSLAALNALKLTDQFVIRFQQTGLGDFNFSGAEDGFLIDQVSVTGQLNTNGPSLVDFEPGSGEIGDRIELTGRNFTADTKVFFNGQAAKEVQFVSTQKLEVVVPALATSGRIRVRNDLGQDLSATDFQIIGQQVIFFEDFETAQLRSMWTANSSTEEGLVEVNQTGNGIIAAYEGLYGAVLGKTQDGQFNVNTLDLAIPLGAFQGKNLIFSFYLKSFQEEYQAEDGVYLSDDGGQTFTKVIDLRYDLWTGSQFGQLPPYDLDELASRNNLVLNDDFVIRFQQAGNGDFNFSGAEDGLFLDNILIQEQTITHAPLPFEEGFESGVLGPAWKWGHPLNTIGSPDYIRPGGRLAIGSSSFIAYNGLNGLTMGRYYDGNYTVNALDLHLDLAGESDVYLQYWINDFEDELDPEDGLYFSDDGGQSFHKVWQFNYGDWTLGYGHIPPIPVHRLAQRFGLQLNDRFVIRFQQAGVGDYNYSGSEDGLLIDDIRVYAQEKEYATLPFVDNFENGLSSFWQWNTNDQTAPLNSIDNGSFLGIVEDPNFAFEGQGYLTFGRIFDGSYTSIAADLHLQLEDFSAVDLQFQYRPYFEEQNEEDGIWASDDGGQHFTKIYQFQPQLFPQNAYSPIQLAIDSLADLYGLRLSNAFILRFQQAGTGDFNTSGSEDGMLIDQLSVTGVANTAGPRITSFTPSEGWPGTRVSILGERLTNDTEVFFNGVAAADVRFVNAQRLEAIVPAAASSGRIKVSNDLGEDVSASDFKVLGREVIFFEDFETGQLRSMWTANSSTDQGLVEVVQRAQSVTYAASEGWYAAALGKTVDGQLNANTLDLSIPLAIYQGRDLELSFFIRHFYEEYQPEDGVYFSDDGGRTFTKVTDLRTDQWVNDRYGQLPPFDLDELAERNGLQLTDDFIIRFQQSDNGDFNFSGDEDGILLDNILIKEVRPTYAQLPFEDSFESGELSDNWQWSRADSTAGVADYIRPSGQVTVAPLAAAARTGFHGLLMGNRYDGLFTVNALDLLLDLSGQREVVLSFWLYDFYDETQEQDGLYFSSDGGKNFRKIYDLDPSSYPNLQYQQFELGLDSLVLQAGMSFSANSVLRFQQGDFGDFNTSGSEDGWFLDDVQVSGQQDGQSPQITYFEPARGQVDDLIILKGFHLNGTNRVSFAGANANNLLVVDDNTVRVRVPDGAQSGPITLETPNGIAQSPYDFILAQGFDLGPVQLVEPLSECARNESVPVRVVVRNFGEEEVQSFRLGYQVNGGPAVVETISKSIEPGEEYEHTFNQTFSLASSGNFTVELFTELAQDENPSNNRISRNVLISSSPMATASASDSDICPGTITVLTASGGTSYLWNTGAIAANISVAPEETTDYSVTVTNEEGCSNVASVRVNVLPTPTPEISTPDGTVLCGGDSIRLISNLSDNIIWSDNRTFDPELIVTRPGFYRLRYFGDNGCSSESEWIQVDLSRPLSISSSGSGIICQGDSETLSVSNAVESIWSTGAMSNSITVSPLEETSYSVTATNNLGCTYVDSVVIRVIPSDVPGVVSNMLPEDGAEMILRPVAFSWSPASNASLYDLYLWENGADFPNQPTASNIQQVQYNYFGLLQFGQTYQWSVIARNSCSVGDTSAIQQFTVSELSDLTVASIQTPPGDVFSASPISIQWVVRNVFEGETGSRRWFDAVYLSRDTILSTSTDIFLGTSINARALSGMGDQYNQEITYTLPQDIEGLYYAIVVTDAFSSILEQNEQNNQRVSSQPISIRLTPPPDLTISRLAPPGASGTVIAGSQEYIEWEVTNQGPGPTLSGGWFDRVYYSQDSILNLQTATRLATVYRNGNLAPDSSYVQGANIDIPANLEGPYFFYVRTDYSNLEYEHNFENNNRERTDRINIIGLPVPNFVLDSLQAPPTASNAEQIQIQWFGRNKGANYEGFLTDAIYLSDQADLSGSISLLRSYGQRESYTSDSSYLRSAWVTLPGRVDGNFFLVVQADAGNAVDEGSTQNEEDNLTAKAIQVLAANLTASNVSGPNRSVRPGDRISVQWTVSNTGDGSLLNRPLLQAISLSDSPNYTNLQSLKVVSDATSLAVGDSLRFSTEVELPNGLTGTQYLVVQTNFTGGIYEAEQLSDNRAISSQALQLVPGRYPNLRPIQVDTFSVAIAGAQRSFSYQVENQGDTSVIGNWIDQVFLSNTADWTTGSRIQLAQTSVSQILPVGNSYEREVDIRIPIWLPSGTYYLFVQTDVSNQIYEDVREDDNVLTAGAIQIEAYPVIDLRIQQAFVSANIKIGQAASLFWQVANVGDSPTPVSQWRDGLYLSENTSFDPDDDFLLAEWIHSGGLAAGESYSKIENFVVPNRFSGQFYLILVTDYEGLNPEDNLSNNRVLVIQSNGGSNGPTVVIDFPPAPDLTANILTAPNNQAAGQSFVLQYEVSNGGADTADGFWTDAAYLSLDQVRGGDDIFLGARSRMRELLVNGSYQDSIEVSVPIDAGSNYFLLLQTDAAGRVREEDERNNIASQGIFIDQPDPADLVATNIEGVDEIDIGSNLLVRWSLENQGQFPARGRMEEGVYLSEDTEWDVGDKLLGVRPARVDLPPGGSVEHELTVKVEDVRMANFYILVKTDQLDNFLESDEDNNVGFRLQPMQVNVPELIIDQLESTSLSSDQVLYYRLEVPFALENETLLLSLGSEDSTAYNELYLQWEQMPNRADYDFAFDRPFSENQDILVPRLRTGTYYIAVYNNNGAASQAVTLLAQIVEFGLRSIDANKGGNSGQMTSLLQGTKFDAQMRVWLEDDDGLRTEADAVYVLDAVRAYVSFDLTGMAEGTYDVFAENVDGDQDRLVDAFALELGQPNSTPLSISCFIDGSNQPIDILDPLAFEAQYPAMARANQIIGLTLRFENTGNVDLPIPKRILASIGGAPLGLTPEELEQDPQPELFLEFRESGSPVEVLRPGAVAFRTVYTKAVQQLRFRIY